MKRRAIAAVMAVVILVAALAVIRLWRQANQGAQGPAAKPAPVEVGTIERGALELRRTFSGSIEARERSVVAAHVRGRVRELHVDLGDTIERGQIVAELDDDEEVQGVVESSADLAVSQANLAEAESAASIAKRELRRTESLHQEGITSTTALDQARAVFTAKKAALRVARARVGRTAASLERAKIRSGYAKVVAGWSGDDQHRLVAERHVDSGDTVGVNEPLLTIVGLVPITAVVHVTEKDYAQLRLDQEATLTTDAYPGKAFRGVIKRIAPVFRQSSRQARVEIEVPNDDRLLKPGMFVRAEVVLQRKPDVTSVPVTALTTRRGQIGVFLVDGAGRTVSWRPVTVGIRDRDRVEVQGDGLEGQVVTLGQQLIAEGSPITIPAPPAAADEDT